MFWKSLRRIGVSSSLNVCRIYRMESSGPRLFCVGIFSIANPIFLLVIGLFRFSISSLVLVVCVFLGSCPIVFFVWCWYQGDGGLVE